MDSELILFFDAANSDDYYNISLGQTHNGWELKTDEEGGYILSVIVDKDYIDNTYIIVKRGKKNYYVGKKN